MDKKNLLTEDEMAIVRKLQSECMTEEEPEDPTDKNCKTFIIRPVPWLKDEVVQLKRKLDEYDEHNSDKHYLEYK